MHSPDLTESRRALAQCDFAGITLAVEGEGWDRSAGHDLSCFPANYRSGLLDHLSSAPRAPPLLMTAARFPSFHCRQHGLAGDPGWHRETQPSQRGKGGWMQQTAFQPSQLITQAPSIFRLENTKFVIALFNSVCKWWFGTTAQAAIFY